MPSRLPQIPSSSAQSSARGDGDYVGTEVCVTCHADQQKSFAHTIMGNAMAHPKTALDTRGCEACHGPGRAHVEAEAARTRSRFGSPRTRTLQLKNAMRLACHAHQGQPDVLEGQPARVARHGLRRLSPGHYGSPAQRYAELSASDSRYGTPLTEHVGTKKPQPELCLQCHQMRRAQLQRSSHMPYREGKVTCTSCHNPHGSPNPSQLLQSTINENCYQLPCRAAGAISVGTPSGHGKLRQLPRAARQQQPPAVEGAYAAGMRLLPRFQPPSHATAASRFNQEFQPWLHQLPFFDPRIESPFGKLLHALEGGAMKAASTKYSVRCCSL